jgi:nicotinic acid mononucleotide adenylyltransferase
MLRKLSRSHRACPVECHKVIVTPFEIENEFKQVSSYDILHIFCDEYNIPPNNFPYIIIGLDNANNINLWKYNEILIDTFPFIVIPRKFEKDIKEDGWYTKEPHILVRDSEIIEDSEMMDCSSTKVRELIKNNANFKDIPITFDVYSYIKNNGFYT